MPQKPTDSHCLRLVGISTSLTSLIFASYAFLYKELTSLGEGFFSWLIILGIATTLFSILGFMYEDRRTDLFYAALTFLLADIIILGIIFFTFFF